MKHKISRTDVARMAGVSEATVSYVFSKRRYVSPDLTKRVLDAAEKLDYYPDMIARSLVMQRTNTVAVLTDDIASPLQIQVIKGMQERAMEHSYFLNVCGGTEQLERYVENFIARRVDGVFISVLTPSVRDVYLEKLADKGISVVITATRKIDDERICGLELDMAGGMRKIINYLKSIGHRRIAYLSAFDHEYHADRRLSAFEQGMEEQGLPATVVEGHFPYDSTIETGEVLMNRLLDDDSQATAVICTNDLMAYGAISAAFRRGLNVPGDVSVVGIDNIPFSAAYNPPLTTLDHAALSYGRRLFDILYDNITQGIVRRESLDMDLIVRKSTRPIQE